MRLIISTLLFCLLLSTFTVNAQQSNNYRVRIDGVVNAAGTSTAPSYREIRGVVSVRDVAFTKSANINESGFLFRLKKAQPEVLIDQTFWIIQ